MSLQRVVNFVAVFFLPVIHVLCAAILLGGCWGGMLLGLFALPATLVLGLLAALLSLSPCRHRSRTEWAIGGAVVGGVMGMLTVLMLRVSGTIPNDFAFGFAGVAALTGAISGAHVHHLIARLPPD